MSFGSFQKSRYLVPVTICMSPSVSAYLENPGDIINTSIYLYLLNVILLAIDCLFLAAGRTLERLEDVKQ